MSPSTTQQLIALPDELLLITESQWLFSSRELSLTPSIQDGLPAEKERANRAKGVNFILQVGVMLRLPQTTLATASVFLHRLYMRHSMVESPGKVGYHYYPMAATSLFLATKVEETCRKMRELVIACVRVAQKDPQKAVDEQDREYWRWRDNILLNEDLLLEALCFDLTLESPYTTLFRLLVHFQEDQNKRLRNAAWAFVNDSCLTMLCLMIPSKAIAASALFAGAKLCGVSFPDDPSVGKGQPWWHSINVSSSDIVTACNHMCDVYENLPPRTSRETGLYERIVDGNAALDVTRQMSDGRDPGQAGIEQHNVSSSAMSNGTDSYSHDRDPRDGDRQGTSSPLKRRREDSIAQVTAAAAPPPEEQQVGTQAPPYGTSSQATTNGQASDNVVVNGINSSLESNNSAQHATKKQKGDSHEKRSNKNDEMAPLVESSSTQSARREGGGGAAATAENEDNVSEEGEVSEG